MKPTAFSIYSPELPASGVDMPPDAGDFLVLMHADIGIQGEDGSDTFLFYATTRAHLARTGREAEGVPPSTIVVERFSWEAVEAAVEAICDDIDEPNQDAIFKMLARHFEPC